MSSIGAAIPGSLVEEIKRAMAKKPVIQVTAGNLANLFKLAQETLIAGDAGIYQRGGQLVRIATLEHDLVQHGLKRTAGSTVIMPVTKDYLQLALARVAEFEKFDRRTKKWLPADPPANVAAALLAASGEWDLPPLAGVVTAPTLRGDGTVLDAPGYDARSGLFAAFNPDYFPVVADRPSRAAALESLDRFDELFSECIFSGGNRSPHASTAIAAAITACVRFALPTAPAFAINAHKQGSGKTTTAKAIGQLATGRDPPVIAAADDETELKKCLLAILIAGDVVVLLDNVSKPVDSAALCAVLTSATYTDRVLGLSAKATAPTAVTWLITGNSIELVGDLNTRTLLSTLDPECERPEARPFKRDLSEYIVANRGVLVTGALTIVRAYLAEGAPAVNAQRSRFAEWDRLVRLPLLWLGTSDPLETQAELRANDPIREALVAIMTCWNDAFGNTPTSVHSAIEAAGASGSLYARPQLQEALHAVAGDKSGTINAKRLGRYLKRNIRRIENGLRFEGVGKDPATKRQLYRLSGVSGVSGVSTSLRTEEAVRSKGY